MSVLFRLISGVIYIIRFVDGKNIKSGNFVVSSDYDAVKIKSAKFIRIALGDINKLTVKSSANVSDLNICYYLKTSLPSSLESFFKIISNCEDYINTLITQKLATIVYDGSFIIYQKLWVNIIIYVMNMKLTWNYK